jgi:serine/threonine protein kinase
MSVNCSSLCASSKRFRIQIPTRPAVQTHNLWRLIDFGSAARIDEPSEPSFTMRFAAPEALREVFAAKRIAADLPAGAVPPILKTPAYASEDVWALGVIAFELFSAKAFYPDTSDSETIKNMLLGQTPFPHELDDGVFATMGRCGSVVQSMLIRDASLRPDIHTVLQMLEDYHK